MGRSRERPLQLSRVYRLKDLQNNGLPREILGEFPQQTNYIINNPWFLARSSIDSVGEFHSSQTILRDHMKLDDVSRGCLVQLTVEQNQILQSSNILIHEVNLN